MAAATGGGGGGGAVSLIDRSKPLPMFGVPFKSSIEAEFEHDATMYGENRARMLSYFRADGTVPRNAVIVLDGGKEPVRDETDHEEIFRQNSHFHYLFGVREPNFKGVIHADDGKAVLFMPKLDEAWVVWMGHIPSTDEVRDLYKVDEVRYVESFDEYLAEVDPSVVFVNHGKNTDSGSFAAEATWASKERFRVDNGKVYDAIVEARVHKSEKELAIFRYISIVCSEAHAAMMQAVRPGMKEFQLEALFKAWAQFYGGARLAGYTWIGATGANGAVLHYGHAGAPNADTIKEHSMCLMDMGNELYCYGADITTCFPSDGVFTEDQKVVYNAVLHALWTVEAAMRPGVCWRDMHELAYRCILTKLKEGGILVGDVDEMMAVNLGATFMPHGLGHLLGIDTHDVGGYPKGVERPKEAGFRSLRTTRLLEKDMVITCEPGCYFVDALLDRALADPTKSKFFNTEVLARFRGFGGVRLEDNIHITADGIENMTWVPRRVEDVEAVAAGRVNDRFGFEKRY